MITRTSKQLHCMIYMDGHESNYGYKFCIRNTGAFGYSAYRHVDGFKYFVKHYGLKIDRNTVQIYDKRTAGYGRIMTFSFIPKDITERYFWKSEDLPNTAKKFIALENGSYVDLYADDHGKAVTIYRPNPNAKDVYKPYDHLEMDRKIG